MNAQEQIKARQLILRVQNNPTSCSNAELSIPRRDEVSKFDVANTNSTMNLVLRDIQDYLEIGARTALRLG